MVLEYECFLAMNSNVHPDFYVMFSRGGHSLVSSVPMRDQRIVEHTLNSVIDI